MNNSNTLVGMYRIKGPIYKSRDRRGDKEYITLVRGRELLEKTSNASKCLPGSQPGKELKREKIASRGEIFQVARFTKMPYGNSNFQSFRERNLLGVHPFATTLQFIPSLQSWSPGDLTVGQTQICVLGCLLLNSDNVQPVSSISLHAVPTKLPSLTNDSSQYPSPQNGDARQYLAMQYRQSIIR